MAKDVLKSQNIKRQHKVSLRYIYSYFEKGMGYDQYTCSWHCSCRTYLCCFPLALANIRPWPLLSFFEISLKNSELKHTHNTFRDCRVHFFRQPFLKQLCMRRLCSLVVFNITNLGIQKPILGVFLSIKPLLITFFFVVPCNQQGNQVTMVGC